MSFITIDDRAPRTRERISTTGLFGGSDANLLKRWLRSSGVRSDGTPTTLVAVGIILLLLASIASMAMAKGLLPSLPSTGILLNLRPTCSPDHDCWIAVQPRPKDKLSILDNGIQRTPGTEIAVVPPPKAAERTDQAAAVSIPDSSELFGSLVMPSKNWSGPPTTVKAIKATLLPHRSMAKTASEHVVKKVRTAANSTGLHGRVTAE